MKQTIFTFILLVFTTNTSADTLLDAQEALKNHNIHKAVSLWQEACDEGKMSACQNAALALDYGDDVAEDDVKALELYSKACDVGYFKSCSKMALLYEESSSVKPNPNKAFHLYTKACGGKDGFACHNIALYYYKKDLPALKKLSISFYDMACKYGYSPSCIYMGRLYRDVRKVPQNYEKATEQFARACELNNRLGCKEERILNALK